jgi:signal peptidase I
MWSNPGHFIKKQLPILLVLVVVILGIRSSIIEPFRIPTRSMLPGLMTGDFLFANKMQYGLHFPFSEVFANAPWFLGKTTFPKRGDIIIFTPADAGQDSLYIKRVVGLPGDRIRFEEKQFYLNDQKVEKKEVLGADRDAILSHPGFDPEGRYTPGKLHVYQETFPGLGGDKGHVILEDDSFEGNHATPEIVVPDDHFFVLGDNRDDTRDSRVFGVISFNSIRGRAFVIWFSYRISMNDSHWSFRPERIGKIIQ